MPSQSNLILTYIVLVFIWSTTPLAIIWSISDIHMMWAMILRFAMALVLAVVILAVLKIPLPFDRVSLHSYLAGAFSLIGSQFFTYAATPYLSSGMLALMFGLAPIMAGLIGYFIFSLSLQKTQWAGMLVAVCGLAIICLSSDESQGQHVDPIGIVLMLVSVFNYALSIFWVKKINAKIEPMAQATGSILFSTLVSLLIIPFIWQHMPQTWPSMRSMLALIYSVVMASIIAMFCYFKLVQNIRASTLSLTTVMTPMFAMLIGALLNQERLAVWALVGAVVMIVGLLLYFAQDWLASRKRSRILKD